MVKSNDTVTPIIGLRCVADQLASARHERGWLLGVVPRSATKIYLDRLGELLRVEEAGRSSDEERARREAELSPLPSDDSGDWDESDVLVSTLDKFLDLSRNPDCAIRFVMTSGIFRPEDRVEHGGRPSFVRSFWRQAKREGTDPVALKLDEFWTARDRLRTVIDLHDALRRGDQEAAVRFAHQLHEFSPEDALTYVMTRHLRQARVTVVFKGADATPKISTTEVLPGLYALLWQNMLRQTPLAPCQRCGGVFRVTRKTKEFCKADCEKASKQAKYRERKATARRLAAEGRTLRQVAAALGNRDLHLIRRWVGGAARKSGGRRV